MNICSPYGVILLNIWISTKQQTVFPLNLKTLFSVPVSSSILLESLPGMASLLLIKQRFMLVLSFFVCITHWLLHLMQWVYPVLSDVLNCVS